MFERHETSSPHTASAGDGDELVIKQRAPATLLLLWIQASKTTSKRDERIKGKLGQQNSAVVHFVACQVPMSYTGQY